MAAPGITEPKPAPPAPAAPLPPHAISDPAALALAVEAILLTETRPVSARRLGEALGVETPADQGAKPRRGSAGAIEQAVAALNEVYQSTGRSFRVESVAGGYRLMTLAAMAKVLAGYHGGRSTSRLSRAAIETLSIIAYKQPMTRAKLEAVRGVACGEVLRSLLERRLITMTGRAEELGRPMLYGTTKDFLDAFGLASLKDLPSVSEFQGQT